MDMNQPNCEAFKEPKAFIKILQVILAIIAFSLTCSFSNYTSFKANCAKNLSTAKWEEYKINYSYPYKIDENKIDKICGETHSRITVYGNYKSESQFFVFVGVITMLYCIFAVIFYVFLPGMMYENDRLPKIDLVVTAVIAALWFIASIAWAYGVTHLKQYTTPSLYMTHFEICQAPKNACEPVYLGAYGSLNASLIAGFSNVALWSANIWFVFKETLWYERRNPEDQIMGSDSADGGNM